MNLDSLNLQFFETYKSLDSLLKDMYCSGRGVSDYIDDMEETNGAARLVPDWDFDLKQLRRLRHIRNQLAHEKDAFCENFCTNLDILWLENFRKRLLNRTDPISLYQNILKAERSSKQNNPPPRFIEQFKKTGSKTLLFAALAFVSFAVIISLILIYLVYYK